MTQIKKADGTTGEIKAGARVLLTRPKNDAVADILKSHHIEVAQLPLIKIDIVANADDIDDTLKTLGTYNWITFTSANGVRGFFKEFFKKYADIRSIGIARIACVGDATATELAKYYLKPDIVSSVSSAEAMADEMSEYETLDNLNILCVEGNLSKPELMKKLSAEYNAIVDTVEVYKTTPVELSGDNPVVIDFKNKGADIVVFASPSSVDSFCKNAGKLSMSKGAVHPKIVTIGATTTKAAEAKGMKVAREAVEPTPEAVAHAVLDILKGK